MKTHLILFVFAIHWIQFNCEENAKLDIVVGIDDGKSSIQVFEAKENALIIKENNKHDLQKLKWYSIGKPIVIRTKSNKNKNESFFHIRNDGFFLNVQILSEAHKKLIIQKLNEKYGISVELYQIKEIPLKEFQCDLHLNHDDDETVTKGSTKVLLTRYPLRVDFQANEKEMGFLEKMLLSDHHNELELECAYKSNIGLEETVIIKFENQESKFDCNRNKKDICFNDAKCSASGSCICKNGYNGSFCSQYIGCYAGGELSCLNDGKCLNGVCECRPGYKGKTCSDGKFFDAEELILKVSNEVRNLVSSVDEVKKEIKDNHKNLKTEIESSISDIKKETTDKLNLLTNENTRFKNEVGNLVSSVNEIKKEFKDTHKSLKDEMNSSISDIKKEFSKFKIPFGIQNNVHVSKFISSGFFYVYNKPYNHHTRSTEIDDIKRSCSTTTNLCLGGRDSDNDVLLVVSCGLCSDVFTKTALNTPHIHNGAYWYYTPDIIGSRSMGFAPNSTIDQSNPDTFDASNNQRVSWRLNVPESAGYRLGSLVALDSNTRYYKVILKRDNNDFK